MGNRHAKSLVLFTGSRNLQAEEKYRRKWNSAKYLATSRLSIIRVNNTAGSIRWLSKLK